MKLVVPFADFVGIENRERSQTRGIATLPDRTELTNHIGSQHAGALYTVAEAASGAAVIGAFGGALAEGAIPLVRQASIQYLKVARGPIQAVGAVQGELQSVVDGLKTNGKVDFAVLVELTDAAGVLVATSAFDWHLRAARK